jgi:hypothetical protein
MVFEKRKSYKRKKIRIPSEEKKYKGGGKDFINFSILPCDILLFFCITFTYRAILPDILILNRQTGNFAYFQYSI